MNVDTDPLGPISILILIFILTYINGFFASAEMAVVSIGKSKLDRLIETKDKRALLLQKLTVEPTRFLSTIQVAITLAGFLSSATAGSKLSVYIVAFFGWLHISLSETIAMVIVTVLLSFFTLVFGELFPKRIALKNPEMIALKCARTVYVVMIIFRPFVRLLSFVTNLLLKITGKNLTNEETVSEDEIRRLIITGHTEGLIQESEKEMLESIFRFDDLGAEAIMTPRTNIYAINIERSFTEYLDQVVAQGYTRIPVYRKDIDNIVGILNIKDLFREAKQKGFEKINIEKILRKPYFVPKHIKIDVLFRQMQATNNQMAILIDEYGGLVGLVTIEDLVEEIVGNIYDEYDEEDKSIQEISANTYLVDGGIQIQDLNRRLKLDLDENNEEYDTLGGLIIHLLGYIPTANDLGEIPYRNYVFQIHKLDDNRIEDVLVTVHPKKEEDEEDFADGEIKEREDLL